MTQKIPPSLLREILIGLALLAGTIVLMLVLGEISVRLLEPPSDKQPLYQTLKDSPRRYGLLPNRTVLRDGVTIHTNSLGNRGGECSHDKLPGTFRILGLGDSYTFGAGVEYEDTYLRILEKLLNKSNLSGSLSYESVNLGVEGYNTVQELASLREEGLSLQPDLILVGYLFNDVDDEISMSGELPIGQPVNMNSVLTRFILDLKARSHLFAFVSPRLAALLRKFDIRNIGMVGSYANQFVEGSIGWKKSQDALLEMDALARSADSRLAVLVFPAFVSLSRGDYPLLQYHRAVTNFCQAHGIPVYDLYPDFEGKTESRFWVSLTDPHPNSAANHVAAEAIYRFLASHNLVPTSGL
jgi:lysophospholipase L1-like esterase